MYIRLLCSSLVMRNECRRLANSKECWDVLFLRQINKALIGWHLFPLRWCAMSIYGCLLRTIGQSNSCKYGTDFLVNFLCVSYYHAVLIPVQVQIPGKEKSLPPSKLLDEMSPCVTAAILFVHDCRFLQLHLALAAVPTIERLHRLRCWCKVTES